VAIFADLETLCAAPDQMISAGIGDMLGKYTSLADWRLGELLWDEPYNAAIAARTRQAMILCTEQIPEIRMASTDGIGLLTRSLVESGLAMIEAGNSRPASGAEHHLSHYWELKLLQRGQPAILHGIKVGLALLHVSGLYQQLRQISAEELETRLSRCVLPAPAEEVSRIQQAYGAAAPAIIKEQTSFIYMSEAGFANLKERVLECWPAIQEIISSVPEPEQISQWLTQAGIPTRITDIDLTENDLNEAVLYAHYLRNRFTVLKLARLLGVIA
jgi:glycerol-1-phosphate dehydrogenase [NAD(P)+]